MNEKSPITLAAAVMLVAGLLAASALPAAGAQAEPPSAAAPVSKPGQAPSAAAVALANTQGFLIVSSKAGLKGTDGATFYPTGAISEDTLVVISESDGSLPAGLSIEQIKQMVVERRAAAGQGSATSTGTAAITTLAPVSGAVTPMASSFPRAYTANSTAMSAPFTGASIWGWDSTARVGYSFNVMINSQQVNAAQGLGWYRGYNGSTMGTWSKYYNLGTTDADSVGGGTVPWGNVIASAKFRARCVATTLCNGSWAP